MIRNQIDCLSSQLRQSKENFSQLFARSTSLKRTKSLIKLDRRKQRSHESLFLSRRCGNGPLGSILPIDRLRFENSLDIWILEAKGLPAKNKYYVKIFLDDHIYGKTTSQEQREILFWGEYFLFKDLPKNCSRLHCKVYREQKKQINEIGFVDIPLAMINGNQFVEQWYRVQTTNGKEKSQKNQDQSFNIRIKSKYQAIEILPIDSYLHLQDYIRRNYLRLIEIVEPHINLRDKDEIATSLTRIAHSLSFSVPFLVDIIQAEIFSIQDSTLTFRGNSIATKSMEAYMKLIGETYLRETLTRIVSSKNLNNEIDLEVDPDRVINRQNLERNQITLRVLCEQIWSDIQQSHTRFPRELKRIFSKLRQLSSSDETMFNLISGSVFLRFLCPAILSPNLFGLTQEYPNEKASRKLTLIAKTLQTLANFSKFGPKESYMKFMNDFVSKETANMHRFLANISTLDQDSIDQDLRHDIDLGHEYAILHSTLTDLFDRLDLNIRQRLDELESILHDLSNIKSFYLSSKKPNSQMSSSRYSSQTSLSLNDTTTTNASSQGYHSISTSSTMTNLETLRTPLAFTNPLYNEKETADNSQSDDETSLQTIDFLKSNESPLIVSSLSQSKQKLDRPKMGVKALNHLSIKKTKNQSFPLLNLYQEEKSRRIQCEKQSERLFEELTQKTEQIEAYRQLLNEKILLIFHQ